MMIVAALLLGPVALIADVAMNAAYAADEPAQSSSSPSAQFVQNLGDKALKIIADKSLTPSQRTQKYSAILHDAFDLPDIGKFVLGRAWKTATPAQQTEYMKLFEANVIKIYGDRLSFYSGESFKVKSTRPESDNDSVVTSEIEHPDGQQPTTVDWRVRNQNGKLAIVDVVIEGVSQSVTERQEYASIIERNGGNIEALLALMRDRAAKDQNQGQNGQNSQSGPQSD